MAEPEKNYDEDDAVCVDCIEDEALRELVRAEGHDQACVECGERSTAVSIKDLAALIDPYIREHYEPGPYERRYGAGDDDSYWEEQQGEDLSSVVQDVVEQYFEFNDALVPPWPRGPSGCRAGHCRRTLPSPDRRRCGSRP